MCGDYTGPLTFPYIARRRRLLPLVFARSVGRVVRRHATDLDPRLVQFAFSHRRRLHTIVMVMPEHPDPVPQMGVTMGAAALRLAGINCLVAATLDEALDLTHVYPRDERRAA